MRHGEETSATGRLRVWIVPEKQDLHAVAFFHFQKLVFFGGDPQIKDDMILGCSRHPLLSETHCMGLWLLVCYRKNASPENGSFPRQGDPNIDPNILWSLL